jgi:hypothetical protein
MRFASWITKSTDTHSEYAIIVAFLRQQWLRERTSLLRYAHIASSAVLQLVSDDLPAPDAGEVL